MDAAIDKAGVFLEPWSATTRRLPVSGGHASFLLRTELTCMAS
jgi:hypothetical protein